MRNKLVIIGLLIVAGACGDRESYKPRVQNPELLHRSLKKITDIIVHDIFSPPQASRIYAYTSIAAYEVSIHGDHRFTSLAGQLNGLEKVPQPDPEKEYAFTVAAVQATLKVGRALIFSEDKLDEFHDLIMKEVADSGIPADVLERSVAYGDQVADHILKWSSTDNYKQSRSFPKYTILSDPGTWKPTPPGYMDAVEPHWNEIRPFALDSAAQFKPVPPAPFSRDKNSEFYKLAAEVYQVGKNLTDEQKAIANFWDCNPYIMNVKGHVMFANKKISPGGHWMNITSVILRKANKNFVESAEAYTRVAVSLVDGFISCWDEKYRSKLIRPETYINQYIDENWIPLLQTPPFPEYTSGHSVISNAAATALTGIFGDNFSFTDSTKVEYGMTARSFPSFLAAGDEASVSRLYGGIHYRPALDIGLQQGRSLGRFIQEKLKTRQQ